MCVLGGGGGGGTNGMNNLSKWILYALGLLISHSPMPRQVVRVFHISCTTLEQHQTLLASKGCMPHPPGTPPWCSACGVAT